MKKNVAEFLEFRYEKLKMLKRSERGEVWLASTRQGGELVIIKRVAATGLPYDAIKNSEFTLSAKILYCAEDEAETVVVEEFIQGENLLERLERKNFLSESEARMILLQMCDGLAELHAQKIIHRDIKPSNMILQGDKIRLIDFDAARIFKDDKDEDTGRLGTKGYAPPEQFGSGQTDPRSDIYALGVTMKKLLGLNCGERLKEILDRCTEFDPAHRFQNVDELKDALTAEEFDEPETESTPGESRRVLVSLSIKLLWFMIRGKLHAGLILLTIAIFFLATAPALNSNENFSEEIIPQAEESPEEKISPPAQVEAVKFPEIVMPSIKQNAVEMPQSSATINLPPVEKFSLPAPKKSSGLLKTAFYLNGALFDQFAHMNENIKISRYEWRRTQARLQITNDTDDIWRNPTIKFILSQQTGDKVEETKSLPALAVDASAEFVIPFDLLALSERENTSAYIQLWLNGDESKMDEHYWCVWFDLTD